MLVWILNHDIILIGCGLGIVLGIFSKVLLMIGDAIIRKIEGDKRY